MDKSKNILICVYRDTTDLGYDEANDENLVYLEVPKNVVQQYMKKTGCSKAGSRVLQRMIQWTFTTLQKILL